ncbi:molybdenum cofactor biosynthesis protein B [Pyruvatibacter sp.]|uniref:molybdenum cofactor biosynthesis protein B n=1 Tax=Pyruvatibacter sp. TaxID=1981328 RepID=UPI0032ECF4CA
MTSTAPAAAPTSVGFAVLTISDTRDETTDTSGAYLTDEISAAGHTVVDRAIVKDERDAIAAKLRQWIDDPAINAVISTGGTGLTGRDITPEVFHSFYDKEIEGFSVVFHMVSYASVGVSTLQSRATAGIAGETFLFALPGSSGAVRDGWEKVLKAEFDHTHKPCNLIEMIPRLGER